MRRRGLIALVCVVAVAVAIENFLFFSGSASELTWSNPDIDEALDSPEASLEPEPLPPIEGPQLIAWLNRWPGAGRNPFLTRAEEEQLGGSEALALPHLSATLWSARRRVAWIDGSPRSEGDFVREHQVESIEPKSAVLKRGDVRVRVEMESPPGPSLASEGQDDVE